MAPNRPARLAARIPLLAALLLCLASPALAQSGKLTGVVRDATSGEPLTGVQILVEGTGIGILSQENGRFFILNVPPGTYDVSAQLIGYSRVRREGVVISADVTSTVNFDMPSQAVALQEVVVQAQRVPLINTTSTGSGDVVTSAEIEVLPVTELTEVLALQHGFFEPEYNSDVVGQLDQERGVAPLHVRGGRSGETIVMMDGIPVTNAMLGDPSFDPSASVIEQISYSRGGFEAKYGNALSGVVNVSTRTPRTNYQGSVSYQTSSLAGAMGSEFDDFRGYHSVEGNVSGPVPGTSNKLRFLVSGRHNEEAGRVLQFDNTIWSPLAYTSARDELLNYPSIFDLVPGWRSMGFQETRDFMGKLGYYFSPTMKLEASVTQNQRQTQPYSFSYLQTGFDLYGQCVADYPDLADVCQRVMLGGIQPEKISDLQTEYQERQYVMRNSVERQTSVMSMNWDHTIGRVAYNITVGETEGERDTCSFLSGVCLGPRMAKPYTNGPFIGTAQSRSYGRHPAFGTSTIFGGDRSTARFARGDVEWQATDHHNISTGVFYQAHDVSFVEGKDVGLNNIQIEWNRYSAEPWDAAVYFQDRIEYDFITVNLGVRYEYGVASGLFFSNPQDPTNGTTAFHVCENPTGFGLPANAFTTTNPDGEPVSGISACSLESEMMNQALLTAMEDDFTPARSRGHLSPRLGVSLPVTEGSRLFFNYGRFVQNPLLHNLFRMTGIGTSTEGTRQALSFVENALESPLLGNPHLLSEQTASYELGFNAALLEDRYALGVVLYTKDQFGLTGTRSGGIDPSGRVIFDPASTYGSTTFEYTTLLNLDFQTSRGVELTFRRRLENFWAFDLRYSLSQVRTNAAPPEFELQKQLLEDDIPVRREIRSYIDRPHTGSLILRFDSRNETPDVPFGEFLRDMSVSVTGRMSSGVPYTPTLDFAGDVRVERNSGTSPTRWDVDMYARKDFRHQGLRYGVFARIDNLLNTTNCLQVFTSTGRCDSGQITRDRLEAGDTNSIDTISQAWDRPDYLDKPRNVSAGVRISF